MDPETLYGIFDAVADEPAPATEHQPGSGEYGGDVPRRPPPVQLRERYNIAPTTDVPAVRERIDAAEDAGACRPGQDPGARVRRLLGPVHWGLVPSWAKDVAVGNKMFNARAESLAEKPAFRRAYQRRRCLLPASGYYEWRKPGPAAPKGAKKQPFYMTPVDGSVMAFAGIWEYWKSADGEPLVSAAIITTDSVGPLTEIHDRMPLILPASEWAGWLDPRNDGAAVAPLLAPPPAGLVAGLELRPVSQRVGNVRNDDPGLLERVEPDEPALFG
jgi:putative SOS response-associated peptidase YedK